MQGSLQSFLKATVMRWMIAGTVSALVLSSFIVWVNMRISAEREVALQSQAISQSFRSSILGGEVRYSEVRMRASLSLEAADMVKVLDPSGRPLYIEPGVREQWDVRSDLKWSGARRLIMLSPIYFDLERTSLFGYLAIERKIAMDWTLLLMIFGSLMSGQLIFFVLYRISVMRVGEHLAQELAALKRGIENNSGEDGGTSIAELHAIRKAFSRVQDEIGDLERMGRQGKDMRRVAHDIRSPLSALAIGLQSLKQIPGPTRELLDAAYVRMESIAADILKNGPSDTRTSLADLTEMAEDLIAEKSLEHASRGLHWGIEAGEPVRLSQATVSAPSAGLMRSLSNLLNNAAEASPRGSLIRLVVKEEQGRVTFAVIDEGPGIHVQAMPAFLQGGVSSKPGGHGLGLSGARRFAEGHGGSLHLHNLDVGLEVTLTLNTLPATAHSGRIG